MSQEHWLPVAGHEGAYEVSDLGRVRSLPGGLRHGKVLKPSHVGRGYLAVTLCTDGVIDRRYVHHMVAESFIGERPVGLDVCHNDGDMLNNAAGNLRYGTVNANNRDAIAHGRHREVNKTQCKQGHPFSPENTIVRTRRANDGGLKRSRTCRTCLTAWRRTTYLRSREKLAA